MKRLPANFKPTLEDIETVFSFNNEMGYESVISTYNRINQILQDNNCEFWDMNNVINNYKHNGKMTPLIKDLRSFARHKNREIFNRARSSPYWTKCLKRLKKYSNDNLDFYVHTRTAEEAFVDVMRYYAKNWLGFWSIIKIDSHGTITNISLFDQADRDMFLAAVADRTEWKFKSNDMAKRVEKYRKPNKSKTK